MKASAFARVSLVDHGFSRSFFCFLLLMLFSPTATAQTGPARDSPDGSSFGPIVSQKTANSFIILVCVVFVLGLFAVYARHCIGNRRRARGLLLHQETIGGRAPMAIRGLDKAVIASFPTFPYSIVKEHKIWKGSLECAVCLNEFADDEMLRLLPKCSHVFHSDCVDAWLTSNSTCPLCRANLFPNLGDGDPSFSLPVNSDHNSGSEETGDESDNRVAIHVAENTDSNLSSIPNRPVRSWSTGWRLNGIFLRSHTTGHSLVQPIENYERFTLRLPEEVRSQLLNSTAPLNRARSCVALGGIQSSRLGFRTGIESEKNLIFPTNGSSPNQNWELRVNEDAGERSFARLRPPTDMHS